MLDSAAGFVPAALPPGLESLNQRFKDRAAQVWYHRVIEGNSSDAKAEGKALLLILDN